MEIRKVLVLRGPNYWATFPVLEAWVDLGELKNSPSDELPGFNERLMAWLPTMIEHRCSVGDRGGFFERLPRGTYQAHILEHVRPQFANPPGTQGGLGTTPGQAREATRGKRGGRLDGRQRNRSAGRRKATIWQSRPRSGHESGDQGAGAGRLCRGPRGGIDDPRRAVCSRRRLSFARRRRQNDCS